MLNWVIYFAGILSVSAYTKRVGRAVSRREIPVLYIYEHLNFGGASIELNTEVANFQNLNEMGAWNDRVSSVAAKGADWELYTDWFYQGSRMVLLKDQARNAVHDNSYSSARPICTGNPKRAVLHAFSSAGSQGERKIITDKVDYVGDYWNDRISSVYALKGDWELYQHENYEGEVQIIRQGQRMDVYLDNQASSIRPRCY